MIDRLSLNQMKQQQSVGTRVCVYIILGSDHTSLQTSFCSKKKLNQIKI